MSRSGSPATAIRSANLLRLDGADAVAPADDLRGRSRRRDDGVHRRLAEPHAVRELAGVLAVRHDGGVGREADRQARLHDELKRAILHRLDLLRPRLLRLRHVGIRRDRFAGVQRRHEVRMTGPHQLDRLVVHHAAVIDGVDAGADRRLDAVGAVRVRGDVTAPA